MKRMIVLILLALALLGTRSARAQSDGKRIPITAANAAQLKQVGQLQIAMSNPNDGVDSMAFSLDGSLLVTSSWEQVQLFDVKTTQSKAIFTGPTKPIVSVAISPDGSLVAAGRVNLPPFLPGPMIWLWDVKTGQPKVSLQRK